MIKLLAAYVIVYLLTLNAALAQTETHHAVGNLYTKTLNLVESRGMLHSIEGNDVVEISDMHIDHGQVVMVVERNNKPKTIVYDMISNRLVGDDREP